MSLAWDPARVTPYLHWRADTRGASLDGPTASEGALPAGLVDAIRDGYDVPLDLLLPEDCLNRGFADSSDWLPGKSATLPDPPKPGTPITCIIDSGIALRHEALRANARRSRVLAAWLQGADWTGQSWLPFGRELWRPQIEALIAAWRTGKQQGSLNAAGFDVDVGSVNMARVSGSRALMHQVSHGNSVVDLAAGAPETGPEPTGPVILVDLPDQAVLGTAGGALNLFAAFALYRITAIADLLWSKLPQEERGEDVQGYPLVVNFSYGKQTDSGDFSGRFARVVAALNAKRQSDNRSKLHLVLPAGNDNLMEGRATFALKGKAQRTVPWVLPPEDQTPNYLTILGRDLKIGVSPPDGPAMAPIEIPAGTLHDVMPGLRIYCAPPDKDGISCLTICAAPSAPYEIGAPSLPSGPWTVTVLAGEAGSEVTLEVQTDRPERIGSAVAQVSWISDPHYRRYEATSGAALDAHGYCSVPSGQSDPAIVTRRGTINAYASVPGALVVAGYRASDGKPSILSGTGLDDGTGPMPALAFAMDRSVAEFGVLASSAAGTTRLPVRGTSFAAASATRILVERITGKPGHDVDAAALLGKEAAKHETQLPESWCEAHPEKIGQGRWR